MATSPPKQEASSFPDQKVAEDANQRLKDARAQKTEARADLQEAYFFTRPRLSWNIESTVKASKRRDAEQEDLATGIGAEVSEDFATEVVSAFFPQGTDWVANGLDES